MITIEKFPVEYLRILPENFSKGLLLELAQSVNVCSLDSGNTENSCERAVNGAPHSRCHIQ